MKNGEIREGNSLHFDGNGFYTKPEVNHFKVNRFMLKKGFTWETDTRVWVQLDGDSDPLTQEEAVVLFNNRRRWWQILKVVQ